jgi:transcriptional regulator with XRE-family HTH domain
MEHPIRSIRINRRLTQTQLSKILNASQAQVSAWETSAIPVPSHIIRSIANIFKKNEDKIKKESENLYAAKKKKLRKYFEK